jgi:hypothetical protein
MTEGGPRLVGWTDHALVKAEVLGLPRADVEEAVRTGHRHRRRNTGAAHWLVTSGRIAIAYDYPSSDDMTALVVTVWRQS